MGGIVLRTVATPLTFTGLTVQSTAKGIVKTGVVLSEFGERCELKGLQFADSGAGKMYEAKLELGKSREERKLERDEAKSRKIANDFAERQQRIKELQAARDIRRQFAQLAETSGQLQEMSDMSAFIYGKGHVSESGMQPG